MCSKSSLEDLFGVGATEKYQHYICPGCNEVLKDAVQTNCGHFLCEDCAGLLFYTHKDAARCPLNGCKQILLGSDGTKYFLDRHLRREIAELQVTCCINGCDWNGCYKDYASHHLKHPPAVWESVSKRRASHVLIPIQDKQQRPLDKTPQSLRQTAQQLKQSSDDLFQEAEDIEKFSSKAEYVERGSADSLRKHQKETGAEASSNQSLKRAEELWMFREDRSGTLDATTACNQVRFETTPETELTLPHSVKEASKQEKRQLVPGKPSALLSRGTFNPTTQTSPANLPSLTSSVVEQGLPSLPSSVVEQGLPSLPSSVVGQGCIHSAKASNCTNDGASASSPRKGSSRTRRPYALQLVNPKQVTLPTLSPTLSPRSHLPPIQQLSMSSSRNQPLSPGAASLHLQRPQFPAIPKPAILNTKRTPVPRFLIKKASTMPQESNQCPLCKENMTKIKILTSAVEGFIKEIPTHSCRKENETFYRKRFMSF